MFQINRRTDYAVRVMLTLAKGGASARQSTGRIQSETLVPMAFLQRIVSTLRRAGLIHAFPGIHGGLQLARPPEAISLLDVHAAVEGPILISECLADPCRCPLSAPCPVRSRWARLDGLIQRELAATTLADLARAPVEKPARRAKPSRRPSTR